MDFDGVLTWKDNFSIYKENLSIYYILSIVISFLSVFFTWWYHKYNTRRSLSGNGSEITDRVDNTLSELSKDKENDKVDCIEPMITEDKDPKGDIVRRIRLVVKESQNALHLISAGMTEDQIREERECGTEADSIFKVSIPRDCLSRRVILDGNKALEINNRIPSEMITDDTL